MDALDVNEVEVFVLLKGCRELLRLGGYKAILKGDFFQLVIGAQGSLLILGGL